MAKRLNIPLKKENVSLTDQFTDLIQSFCNELMLNDIFPIRVHNNLVSADCELTNGMSTRLKENQ